MIHPYEQSDKSLKYCTKTRLHSSQDRRHLFLDCCLRSCHCHVFTLLRLLLLNSCFSVNGSDDCFCRSITLFSSLCILQASSKSICSCLILAWFLSAVVSVFSRFSAPASILRGERLHSLLLLIGLGLARLTWLPGVTGCLLTGLKCRISDSIELLLP